MAGSKALIFILPGELAKLAPACMMASKYDWHAPANMHNYRNQADIFLPL